MCGLGFPFLAKQRQSCLGSLADAVGCSLEGIWGTDLGLSTQGYWRLQGLGVRLGCWQQALLDALVPQVFWGHRRGGR